MITSCNPITNIHRIAATSGGHIILLLDDGALL
jgi:hypothetical protein